MRSNVAPLLDAVYAALHDNNKGLDEKIVALKTALVAAGEKSVTMQKDRLPNNSRPGRKMLQTYFKKRGVVVTFDEA